MKRIPLPNSALPPAPPAHLLFPPVDWQPWDTAEWLAFFREHGIEAGKWRGTRIEGDGVVYEVEE